MMGSLDDLAPTPADFDTAGGAMAAGLDSIQDPDVPSADHSVSDTGPPGVFPGSTGPRTGPRPGGPVGPQAGPPPSVSDADGFMRPDPRYNAPHETGPPTPQDPRAAPAAPPAAQSAPSFKLFMLYVAPDVRNVRMLCPGSIQALDVIEPFKDDVMVHNVNDKRLEGVQLPGWLDGTPCCVNTQEGLAYRGTDCINHLRMHVQRGLVEPPGLSGISDGDTPFATIDTSTPAPEAAVRGRHMTGAPPPDTLPPPAREEKMDPKALERLIQARQAAMPK